jgi:hypothetical protein
VLAGVMMRQNERYAIEEIALSIITIRKHLADVVIVSV